MPDKTPDQLLGELAVAQSLITAEELEAAVEAQRFAPRPRSLADVMVEMQLLTAQQLDKLIELQQSRTRAPRKFPTNLSELFGHLAMERGYVTLAQVDECLAEQKRLEADGQQMRLGQIMVRRRYLTTEQFLEILRAQEEMVRTCAKCGENLISTPEGGPSDCRKCGEPLPSKPAPSAAPKPREASASSASRAPVDPRAETAPLGDERPRAESSVRSASGTASPGSGARGSGIRGPIFPRTPFPGKPGLLLGGTPAPTEGKPFGRYRLLDQIGKGGLATVYKAIDVPLNRVVALKMLRAGDVPDPSHVQRFLREAKMAARLNHPGIVTVHEVGTVEDAHYFTMEHIEGRSFDKLLADRKLSREHALEIIEKVARAVDYAHSCGIVHRDLKPANIMIDRQGQPRITDFGLAKSLTSNAQVALDGVAGGPPYYMSPEQARGNHSEVDARSDIYSLGVMLYEVLVGDVPFKAATNSQIHDKILNADAAPPSSVVPDVPQELETIVMRAIEKDKALRYGSASEFADDLRRFLNGEPITAKKVSTVERVVKRLRGSRMQVVIAAVIACVIGLGVYLALQWKRNEETTLRQERFAKAEAQMALGDPAYQQLLKVFSSAAATNEPWQKHASDALQSAKKALEIDPGFAPGYYRMAIVKHLKGDLSEAESDYGQAISLDRGNVMARFDRGRLYLRQYALLRGRPLGLGGPAGEMIELPEPVSPQARAALDKAAQDFRAALGSSLKPEEDAFARAAVAVAERRWLDAREILKSWADSRDPAKTSPRPYQRDAALLASLVSSASAFEQGRTAKETYREFESAIVSLNNDELAEVHALTPYLKAELAWALKTYDKAVHESGPSAELLVQRGTFRLMTRDYEGAKADYNQALTLQARNVEAEVRLAYIGLGEGKYDEVATRAAAILESAPNDPRGFLLRALARMEKLEDLEAAHQDAEEGRKRAIDDPFATYVLARAKVMAGEAETEHEKAYALADDVERNVLKTYYHVLDIRAEALVLRERFKREARDLNNAQSDIDRCLRLRPGYWRAYQTRGRIRLAKTLREQAIEDFRMAIKNNSRVLSPYLFLAEARLVNRDPQGAMAELGRALEIRPGNVYVIALRGVAHAYLRNKDAAMKDLKSAIDRAPKIHSLRLHLARALCELEEFEDARDSAEQVRKDDPRLSRHAEEVIARAEQGLKDRQDWRKRLRKGEEYIFAKPPNYARAREEYQTGFALIPLDYKPQPNEARQLMNYRYNYACAIAVTAKGKREEDRHRDVDLAFAQLERAMRDGFTFIEIPAGGCAVDRGRHSGVDHMLHDADFESIRADARFKPLALNSAYDHARFVWTLTMERPERRKEGTEETLRWIEKALKLGFGEMEFPRCAWSKEPHTGLDHMLHDQQIEELRKEATFQQLLEKYRPRDY